MNGQHSNRSSLRSVGPAELPKESSEIRAVAETYDLLASWPGRPDYLDHLLDAGRVAVARTGAGVVGYGGAFVGAHQTHLTDLFVRPDSTGRGAGGAILGSLELDPAATTAFASADPRAQALYRRLGLRELDQLAYLVGRAGDVERLRRHVGPLASLPEPDTDGAIEQHRELRGGVHGAGTLSFLTDVARPLTWPSGYAWLRLAPDRACIGPLGSDDDTTTVSLVVAALLEAVRLRAKAQIVVAQSHPAHALLVKSGFTTSDVDPFMAGDPSLVDLARYCPDPDLG